MTEKEFAIKVKEECFKIKDLVIESIKDNPEDRFNAMIAALVTEIAQLKINQQNLQDAINRK